MSYCTLLHNTVLWLPKPRVSLCNLLQWSFKASRRASGEALLSHREEGEAGGGGEDQILAASLHFSPGILRVQLKVMSCKLLHELPLYSF